MNDEDWVHFHTLDERPAPRTVCELHVRMDQVVCPVWALNNGTYSVLLLINLIEKAITSFTVAILEPAPP